MNEFDQDKEPGTESSQDEDENRYRLNVGPVERKLLLALAASGDQFSLDELAEVTSLDPVEIENALALLVRKGLISPERKNGQQAPLEEEDVFDEDVVSELRDKSRDRPAEVAEPLSEPVPSAEDAEIERASDEAIAMSGEVASTISAPESETPAEPKPIEGSSGFEVPEFSLELLKVEEISKTAPEEAEPPAPEARPEEPEPRPALQVLLSPMSLDPDRLKNGLELLRKSHYYAALGISPEAKRKQVRRAYFDLVSFYHPDQHRELEAQAVKPLLAEIFNLLTRAYETLHRKKQRREYDRTDHPRGHRRGGDRGGAGALAAF